MIWPGFLYNQTYDRMLWWQEIWETDRGKRPAAVSCRPHLELSIVTVVVLKVVPFLACTLFGFLRSPSASLDLVLSIANRGLVMVSADNAVH